MTEEFVQRKMMHEQTKNMKQDVYLHFSESLPCERDVAPACSASERSLCIFHLESNVNCCDMQWLELLQWCLN
jgi:hypothetical protein